MTHQEFSDHEVWGALVAESESTPSLKKLAVKMSDDVEAEREELLRQIPMTD